MPEFHYKPEAGPAEVARLVCGSPYYNRVNTIFLN